MKRIKRFGIYQTAKVFGLIYFFASAIILIPMGLMFSSLANLFPGLPFSSGGIIFYILPFFYGFIGFITTAIGCAVYNLISKWTGGIEFEVELSGPNYPMAPPAASEQEQ